MKRSASSRQWIQEHINDPYVQAAKRDGYRSRAAYKLLELHTVMKSTAGTSIALLRPGMAVLDLGAAPGGWSQVAAQLTAPNGLVMAIDLLAMDDLPGVTVLQGDFLQAETWEKMHRLLAECGKHGFDVLLSDMAPNMSGIRTVDQLRGAVLAESVLACANEFLCKGGALVLKLFHGPDFHLLVKQSHTLFHRTKIIKPAASRDRSPEQYLVGIGYKGEKSDASP